MTDQMTNEKPAPAPPADTHPETRQGLLLPIAIPIGAFAVIGLVLFGFSRVLLSVSAQAATAVALIVAVAIMVVATIVASRERLSNGALFSMVGVVAGIAMFAGGIAIVAIGTGEEAGGGAQLVALEAPEGAAATGFQPATLSVAANEPIELDFSNGDPGIQHNVEIFDVDPAANPDAEPLFSGSLISGPGETPYEVPPLLPGSYFFRCAVHPSTMVGTIESVEGGVEDGGGGGGGLTVTAQALKFNTDEIDLSAGQPTTVTFDNQDAGVPHNIAIYNDSSLSETLFQGEQFPGIESREYPIPPLEPGTYYFQCDVHPTMNGSAVVAGPGGGSGTGGEAPPGATGSSPSG